MPVLLQKRTISCMGGEFRAILLFRDDSFMRITHDTCLLVTLLSSLTFEMMSFKRSIISLVLTYAILLLITTLFYSYDGIVLDGELFQAFFGVDY